MVGLGSVHTLSDIEMDLFNFGLEDGAGSMPALMLLALLARSDSAALQSEAVADVHVTELGPRELDAAEEVLRQLCIASASCAVISLIILINDSPLSSPAQSCATVLIGVGGKRRGGLTPPRARDAATLYANPPPLPTGRGSVL